MKKNVRSIKNTNIELLRIISMIMIIILHFFTYTPGMNFDASLSFVFLLKRIMCSICGVGVNCFILISGYFILKSQFKISKIIEIVFETLFYSFICYFFLLKFGYINFHIKDLVFVFLPILTRQYWFITSYMGAYIFSPIIKKIIEVIDQKTHFLILIIGFLLFVVYYNFFFFCDNLNFGGATGIVWFLYLFFVGGYIYKYYKPDYNTFRHFSKYFFSNIIAFSVMILFIILYLITGIYLFLKGCYVFSSVYNSIFIFINSILFFMLFINIKDNYSYNIKRVILSLSSSATAVYLFHDNNYLRKVIWDAVKTTNIIRIIMYMFLCPIVIYTTGYLIDFIRKSLYKMIINEKKLGFIDKIIRRLTNKFNNYYDYRIKNE